MGDSSRAHRAPARGRAGPAHAGPRPLLLLPPHIRAAPRPGCAPPRSADVIGASLLASVHGTSRTTTAADLGVPAGTLRDWLRAARRGATALVAHAAQAARYLGVSVYDHRSTGSWLGSALAEALDALGVAARALALGTTPAPALRTDGGSGISYLELLDTGHRRLHLHEQLRIAAWEESLASVPAWHLANIIIAGRLLASG